MMSQESLNRLRHGVVPVEIALLGEAIDLRFGELYLGQVDPAALQSYDDQSRGSVFCRTRANSPAGAGASVGDLSMVV
jgi:hypothetical protein